MNVGGIFLLILINRWRNIKCSSCYCFGYLERVEDNIWEKQELKQEDTGYFSCQRTTV